MGGRMLGVLTKDGRRFISYRKECHRFKQYNGFGFNDVLIGELINVSVDVIEIHTEMKVYKTRPIDVRNYGIPYKSPNAEDQQIIMPICKFFDVKYITAKLDDRTGPIAFEGEFNNKLYFKYFYTISYDKETKKIQCTCPPGTFDKKCHHKREIAKFYELDISNNMEMTEDGGLGQFTPKAPDAPKTTESPIQGENNPNAQIEPKKEATPTQTGTGESHGI